MYRSGSYSLLRQQSLGRSLVLEMPYICVMVKVVRGRTLISVYRGENFRRIVINLPLLLCYGMNGVGHWTIDRETW